MKNNTSFLLVAATVFAGVLLSFGSVAEFDAAEPQVASTVAPATDAAPTAVAVTPLRVE